MSKDNGGPAFPVAQDYDERVGTYIQYASDGMTLRDYFAAKAMQAMVASTVYVDGDWAQDDISSQAYGIADAMLAERAK